MAPTRSEMTAELSQRLVDTHLSGLRRLARRLVRDAAAAEDAVQETCLRAIESPPGRLDRLHSWLESVLRNVVRKRHRQEQRASRREALVARPDRSQSTIDVVVRQQQLTALTDVIRALPVELQECVFLRYFEDLPPRHIARRTGRPVERVYRDLEVARHKMRRALAGRDAEWQRGLVLLFGFRGSVVPLVLGGGLLLSKKITAVAAVALVAMAAFSVDWWSDDGLAGDPAQVVVTPRTGGALAAESRRAGDPSKEQRRALATAPRDELAPYVYDVEIHARTEEDLPAAGATILLAPDSHVLNQVTIGGDGVRRLRFRGRRPRMNLVVAALGDDTKGTRLRRVSVTAGTTTQLLVRLARPAQRASALFEIATFEDVSEPGARFELRRVGAAPALRIDKDGLAWFVTGDELPVQSRFDESGEEIEEETGEEIIEIEESSESAVSSGGYRERVLTGTVLDARQRPAPRALIFSRFGRTRTNANGRYKLKFYATDDQQVKLRAGGGDFGLAQATLALGSRQEFTWQPVLDRGLELRGQLVDADGKPCTGCRVEITAESGEPFIDGATTGGDGCFAIPNVPDARFTLLAFAAKASLPMLRRSGLDPRGANILPAVHDRKHGSLQFRPHVASGESVTTAWVQLWDETLDAGRLVRIGKKPSRVQTGNYLLRIGAPGLAWQDVTRLRIDAGATTNLTDVDLGERAVLHLGEKPADVLRLLRLHPSVTSWVAKGASGLLALPPGDYRIKTKRGESALRIEAGENRLDGR